MKTYKLHIVILCFLAITGYSCKRLIPNTSQNYNVTYTTTDSLILVDRLDSFKIEKLNRPEQLYTKIALSFINKPYIAKTLDIKQDESIIVNFTGMDCTTFIESCLAILNTLKMGGETFNDYTFILKNIRYKSGDSVSYENRLHYFTEWIDDNVKKGYIKDITKKMGGIEYPVNLNFMSTHPNKYMQLNNDSTLIHQIKQNEKEISAKKFYYIPQDKVEQIENKLKTGMIVGITTQIKGLDIIHTGILYEKNNRIHLLHASSDYKKVMISEKPLSEYLKENKLQSGIMVLRLN